MAQLSGFVQRDGTQLDHHSNSSVFRSGDVARSGYPKAFALVDGRASERFSATRATLMPSSNRTPEAMG